MKLSHQISVALLSACLLSGIAAGHNQQRVHAATTRITAVSQRNSKQQHVAQNQPALIQRVSRKAQNDNRSWFTDGLSSQQLRARNWVSGRESGHRWNVLSYGGRCIGYFQLDPAYLGKKHGHVNLNHKHQVKVADAYAKSRYGSWVHAKHFWRIHHWY